MEKNYEQQKLFSTLKQNFYLLQIKKYRVILNRVDTSKAP
ncbi:MULTISPECIES: tail fiber assembly protein [Photorhabdus]|nr:MULTISPECIES: tail fiber assembly protein [Photorhabdus]MCZ1251771.1 hypothetical protein [Photorhabdus laumondii subsp. laumondii]NDL17998.1 hypothetical protein [Photorhabdus laumondii subsp. laumondii]NDL49814.1 hypothetical protein [Photorhabdus laumondii subsp. laumondii]NDL54342.1 hypothetical protein [Photorhabdus laumondii subsp. laumondii]